MSIAECFGTPCVGGPNWWLVLDKESPVREREIMPAKFTEAALRINDLAREDARALNHDFVGTEHLLLGLFHDDESIASSALKLLGVSPLVVRQHVEEIDGRGVPEAPAHIPCTPRANRALELSGREARHLGHSYVGPEHILLGLVREGEGIAAQVLVGLGVDLDDARQQVVRLLKDRPHQ